MQPAAHGQNQAVDLNSFRDLLLPQGFRLLRIELVADPMLDAIGRPALAKATIENRTIAIQLAAGQTSEEMSVSIYHEVLEAMTIGVPFPPSAVRDFTEAAFEQAAKRAHRQHGLASKASVITFLYEHGFETSS